MKCYLKLICLVSLCLCLPGCAGCQNDMKHIQADWVGLNRKITLYGPDGTKLNEWTTKAKVEDRGGSCYFLTQEGKAVIVSGNFVIEEL